MIPGQHMHTGRCVSLRVQYALVPSYNSQSFPENPAQHKRRRVDRASISTPTADKAEAGGPHSIGESTIARSHSVTDLAHDQAESTGKQDDCGLDNSSCNPYSLVFRFLSVWFCLSHSPRSPLWCSVLKCIWQEENTFFSGLTDSHILQLSTHITDYSELLTLGVKVLHLTNNQVKSAKTDSKQVNEAAYELLQLWLRQQSSLHEAFNLLNTRLRDVKWNQLAHEVLNTGKTSITSSMSHGKLFSLSFLSYLVFSKIWSNEWNKLQ